MTLRIKQNVTVELQAQSVAEVAMNQTIEGNGQPAADMIRGIVTSSYMSRTDDREGGKDFKLISDQISLKTWTADVLTNVCGPS